MSATESFTNMAEFIRYYAALTPHKRAIAVPTSSDRAGRVAYTHLTFKQLEEETNRYARGYQKIGIGKGCKTVVMIGRASIFSLLSSPWPKLVRLWS